MSAGPRKPWRSRCSMIAEAIANAYAEPAFTKKSAARPARAIVVAIVPSEAGAYRTASGCAVPASTRKSAARLATAIADVTASSADAVDKTEPATFKDCLGKGAISPYGSRPPSAAYKAVFFKSTPSPRTAPGHKPEWRSRTEPRGEASRCSTPRLAGVPQQHILGAQSSRVADAAHKTRLIAFLVDASARRPRRRG